MTNTQHPEEMTDAEREAHIQSCGELMLQAYAEGNTEAALGWLQLEQQAIRARSPAQVAAMEQRLGLEPCYFYEQAGRDLPAILQGQAA